MAAEERDSISTVEFADEELRARLTPEQYAVARTDATEPAFTGCFWDDHEPGSYACVVCGAVLFRSDEKFESGSGWPSFWQPAEGAPIEERTDSSHGMVRTEVRCARCDSHLGHLFPDGPRPTGLRYCINSAALSKIRRDVLGVLDDPEPRGHGITSS